MKPWYIFQYRIDHGQSCYFIHDLNSNDDVHRGFQVSQYNSFCHFYITVI